jgi:GNAT superfamily N-acetyltransferase
VGLDPRPGAPRRGVPGARRRGRAGRPRPLPGDAPPLGANEICFLDDLFVDPTFRGGRVGEALLRAVAEESSRRGWGKVRWITADDNYRGRTLYDRVAARTMWVTYEMPAAGPGRG